MGNYQMGDYANIGKLDYIFDDDLLLEAFEGEDISENARRESIKSQLQNIVDGEGMTLGDYYSNIYAIKENKSKDAGVPRLASEPVVMSGEDFRKHEEAKKIASGRKNIKVSVKKVVKSADAVTVPVADTNGIDK